MTTSTWFGSRVLPLPPPSDWPAFVCSRCGARDRRPFPPDDGLCGPCRWAESDAARRDRLAVVRQELSGHLRAAGVPELFAECSRAAWERQWGPWGEDRGLRRLVGWPGSNGEAGDVLIVVYGGGHRATWLGTSIFSEALCQGLAGVWREASEWLRALRSSFGREQRYERVWSEVAEAGVLLVNGLEDPAEVEAIGSWGCAQLADLLELRRVGRKPTIVTSRMVSWKGLRRLHPKLAGLDVNLKYQIEDGTC